MCAISGMMWSLLWVWGSAFTVPSFNLTPGVTPISHAIYTLHMTLFWICVGVGLVVFSIIIYAAIKHRKSRGHLPATFHSLLALELTWIIIPFLILVVMAIPATIVLMKMDDEAKSDLTIKVVGQQWQWKYEYLDQGISFFSHLSTPLTERENQAPKGKWYLLDVDNPLVLPTQQKVRFLVTSSDVIHSWWVPALGIKRDAIPGFIYETWARIEKPGIYRGQCAELCGVGHGYMPIVVVAKTPAEFQQWVKAQRTAAKRDLTTVPTESPTQLMSKGQQVYSTYCAVCHKADGTGIPPSFPAIKGGPIALGPLQAHIDIVLNGQSNTAMPAFKDQLTAEEIAAVITYERNSWGNNNQQKYGKTAGGWVQPIQVIQVMQEKKS